MVNFARGWWGRGILAECAADTHTHAHIAMKVKRKEWSEARGSGKNRFGIYLSAVCAGEDGLRLIGNQGTLGGIEGLCFEMGLLIKCCPQTAVSRGVLQLLFCLSFSESEGFFLFLRWEKRKQKVWCGSWYTALLKGLWYDDFLDFKLNIFQWLNYIRIDREINSW